MSELRLDPNAIKRFQPFANLSDEQFILLNEKITIKSAKAGKKLFKIGSKSDEAFFLVDGVIELINAKGEKKQIKAGSDEASSAIAQLKPRVYHVVSKSKITYLLISDEHLRYFISQSPTDKKIKSFDSPEETSEINPAFQEILLNIYADYKCNRLTLPSLPDAALRIRRMVDDDTATSNKISQALSLDPSLTTNLIRVVNSPLYRTNKEIRTLNEAVIRLGLNTTKNLVINFSLRNIFVPNSKKIKALLIEIWTTSIQTATFCYVAAKSFSIDPEEALLGGLLNQIGAIPVLQYTEIYKETFSDPKVLYDCIKELKAPLGAFLLEKWQFPESLINCAKYSNTPMRMHRGPLDIADISLVGDLLTHAKTPASIEEVVNLPAYQKMFPGHSDTSAALDLAEQGKKELIELRNLLSIY